MSHDTHPVFRPLGRFAPVAVNSGLRPETRDLTTPTKAGGLAPQGAGDRRHFPRASQNARNQVSTMRCRQTSKRFSQEGIRWF